MERLAYYFFVSGSITVALGLGAYLLSALVGRVGVRGQRVAAASAGGGGTVTMMSGGQPGRSIGQYGTMLTSLALAMLTFWLITRSIAAGRGPFSNMHDFSVAFAWAIVLVYMAVYFRYRSRALGLMVLPLALALLIYAATVPSTIKPLVPALQNSTLLTVHVSVAIIAYACFAVAFGAGALYLVQVRLRARALPDLETLDEVGFVSAAIGFPFMALVLILGAYWANVAWGRYWGWDPKETASFVTLLLYSAYLHARALRGWRGQRAATLLVIGFVAVMLTYFGNYFLGGLHSYRK